MRHSEKILCKILGSHLWGRALPEGLSLPHAAFMQLVELAQKQTVVGVMGQSLITQQVGLERVDAAQLYMMVGEMSANNKDMNRSLCELCGLLQHESIPFVVVKGQTLAALYPSKLTRTPGDIDFYVPPTHFEQAKTLIESEWGLAMEVEESEQHYHFEREDVVFEMHFNLMAFNSPRLQRYWDRLLGETTYDHIDVDGVSVPVLPPTLNLLYTFLHLYHHLIELGVGLRHFCDIGVLLHVYRDCLDSSLLRRWLDEMGFLHAFAALEWLLAKHMGLPAEDVAIEIGDPYACYEDDILDIVFTGGNFGKYSLDNDVRGGMGYFFETGMKKLGRYRRLYSLSPIETRASLFVTMPKKVWMALTGKI